MLQFAANLGFLFQEVDLLARYNAAASTGFRGVETPLSLRPDRRARLPWLWIGCEYHPRQGTVEGLGWARPYGLGPSTDAH